MIYFFALTILLGLAVAGGLFFYACTVPSSQIFRPVLACGPADGRRLALTFDDGPSSPFTEQILDTLRAKQVAATFFVCGKNVERHPEIVRRALREGHTLGNHTYSHPFLYFRRRETIADEIDRTQAALEKVAGIRPRLFRPPYGGRWLGLMPVLAERDMIMIMWSATGYDWKYRTEAIVRSTLEELGPGAVILLHDGHNVRPLDEIDRSGTVRALPVIIDKAREAGFRFVPLQEFIPK